MLSEISKVTRLQMGITQNMSLFFKKVHYVTATCAEKCIIRESEMKCLFVVYAFSAAVSYQKEFLLCWCSGEAQGQAETQSSLIHYQHVR